MDARPTDDDATQPLGGAAAAPATGGPGQPSGTEAAFAAADVRDRPRVGTVVWGLVLAAVGIGLVALASGVRFDVELAVIVVVAVAGVALLAGSLVTARRRR